MHGDLTQPQRLESLRQFKSNSEEFNFMLATDLAARGLDFPLVDLVVNFDLVTDPCKYVHRVGRTARAGNSGESISLFDDKELLEFKRMGKKMVRKKGDKMRLEYLKIDFDKVRSKKFLVSKMENRVRSVLKREHVVREIEKAEMAAKKAQNLLQYGNEIFSRPKRQWIVSGDQKQKIKDAYKGKRIKIK